jgi:hypothetical protein
MRMWRLDSTSSEDSDGSGSGAGDGAEADPEPQGQHPGAVVGVSRRKLADSCFRAVAAARFRQVSMYYFIIQYSLVITIPVGYRKSKMSIIVIAVEVPKQCPDVGMFARHRNNRIYRNNRHCSNEGVL